MPLPYVNIPDGHLGPVPIHPFGVLVATGVLIGTSLMVRRGERYGIPRAKFESFISYSLVFGFVLSHVLDELMYRPREALHNPLQLLKIWAGISSYGGIIGGVVGALVYGFVKKEKILPYLEHVGAIFPIAWIFGRSGCSVAHDHIGRESASFLAVNFPGGPRFDLGLLELMATIPIAGLVLWFASKPRRPGQILALVALVYAPIRFGLDALRAVDIANPDARYFGFTPGQWLSIALLFVGVALLVHARGKPPLAPVPRKPAEPQPDPMVPPPEPMQP
ncbi:MAG: prolipoprotein diacylglyceryl transferase [Polyangiales bacterium]